MKHVDLLIIGGGPGGYEIAAEAARSGRQVTLIERDLLGGTCLNRGCIPTKCLCASASTILTVKHAAEFGVEVSGFTPDYSVATARMNKVVEQLRRGIDTLLKNVDVVHGEARLDSGRKVTVGDEEYEADQILIATGSKPASLNIEGAELAMTSDEFLKLTSLPAAICIIGGGVIGMEFASILAAFGVEVSVIEYCKEILPPFDKEVAKRLRTTLSRRGVKTVVGAAVTAIRKVDDSSVQVIYTGKKGEESVTCNGVIMAVGRRPVVPDGVDKAGISLTPRGFIDTDDDMATSAEGIYAVGDVNGRCMLAHAAAAQARVALGEDVDLEFIPSAVFTIPECAMCGLTEDQCEAEGIEYATAKSMFAANGKALAMGEGEGFVKIIYSPSTRLMLGCHIIGPHAADIVAEATAFMVDGTNIDEIATAVVHGHPTLSETLAAACAAAK